MIEVIINGENRSVAKDLNLRELLKNLELPDQRIAIELNKNVVRKKDWEEIRVSANDKIEIIHFVGGG